MQLYLRLQPAKALQIDFCVTLMMLMESLTDLLRRSLEGSDLEFVCSCTVDIFTSVIELVDGPCTENQLSFTGGNFLQLAER